MTDAALDRALDLQGNERSAYLGSLPDTLRSRVEALLTAAESDGPLDLPIAAVAGRLLGAADTALDPEVTGRRIGSWRLLSRLGSGGMGVVYLAERADEHYDHRAALKVIRWELADPALVQRFLAERQILAQLNHPNIATLLDGGVTDAGLPFLVLEYVDGCPVDRFCDDEDLGIEDRVRLMATVCRAVDFAHRQLVVHRDLKPSNILVRSDGVAKLVDFGVAKLLNDTGGDEPTRFVPMTPRYAAPEQRRGAPVGVAADVWALGVVIAEVVSGERVSVPGEADDPAAGPMTHPHLRGDLANIIARALRSEPEQRYRSAGELADDLERFVDGLPVVATRPTLGYRLGKLIRRHRAAAAAAVVAHLIAVAGLGGILWQSREARRERDMARQQAVRAEQVTSFLRELFGGAVPRVGGEPQVRDLLDEGAARIRSGLADAPAARAELLETLGSAYKWLREFDRSEELLTEAIELQKTLAPGSEGRAEAEASLGGLYMARGDPERAEAQFLRALAILDDAHAGRGESRATVLNSLGMVRLDRGDPDGAEDWLRQSVEIYDELGDSDVAAARGNLGRALDRLGRHGEAEVEHRTALEIYRTVGPTNAAIPSILSNLAINLSSQGRLDEAVEVVTEARDVWRSIPGAAVDGAKTEANLAYLLTVAGRSAEAAELATSAVAILNEAAPGSTSAIATEANLGWALAMSGDFDQALPLLEEVVDDLVERFGPDHVVTARGRTRLGAALHRAGRPSPARRQLEDAVRVVEQASVSPVSEADLMVVWAALCCDIGQADAGLEAATRAIAAYEQVYGASDWNTTYARVERQRCLAALGRAGDPPLLADAAAQLARVRGEDAWETRRADTEALRLRRLTVE